MNLDLLKPLIQALLDGEISATDQSILESELLKSEEAREVYLEYVEIHSLLEQKGSLSSSRTVISIDQIIRGQKRKTMRIFAMATAAAIIIGLMGLVLFDIEKPLPPVSFDRSRCFDFTLTHGPDGYGCEDMVMQVGTRLQLSQGRIDLKFASGVKSIVSAPADLTLYDDEFTLYDGNPFWRATKTGCREI